MEDGRCGLNRPAQLPQNATVGLLLPPAFSKKCVGATAVHSFGRSVVCSSTVVQATYRCKCNAHPISYYEYIACYVDDLLIACQASHGDQMEDGRCRVN